MATYIGIDPGVNTGLAVWMGRKYGFIKIETLTITKAISMVKALAGHGVKVIVEDARLRKKFGPLAAVKQQGAGSIKRDSRIWEDFLKEEGIEYQMVHPKNTKLREDIFMRTTGYKKKTSEHGRDAAMIVYGR